MTRLSRGHPRYASLVVRARLAEALREGTVVAEGLIAQGRAEAFDYLLGERTIPSARRAERVAAHWLRAARHPVISVNGNVAALASPLVARLARSLPRLGVEVNLFHRTSERLSKIGRRLRAAGVPEVLGLGGTVRIPGLPSDRARVDPEGIGRADVCIVPLEDGDRAGALHALGKRIISIDLNPLSRTSETADLPIVDELTRALKAISLDVRSRVLSEHEGRFPPFDGPRARADALRAMGRWAVARQRARRFP